MRRSQRQKDRPRRPLRVAGLFAGIGGIELGLHRAGHRTALLCEVDPGAQAVLQSRFPGVPLYGDICQLAALPDAIDVLSAGFPCQDLSQAGKTVGIAGSRSGLVGEIFRLLRRRPVPWLLLENVPFMLQLMRGQAMEVIVASLEELGYRWAYRVVTTRAFGLPQRRERVYLVASMTDDPRAVLLCDEAGEPDPLPQTWERACGFYWTEGIRGLGWAIDAVPTLKGGSTVGIPSPPAIVLPDGRVVTPDIRDAERLQGFPADWTRPAEGAVRRSQRWKLVGNAVTVEVARWIGERLREPGSIPPARWQECTPLAAGRAWPRVAWNVGQGRFTAPLSGWPFQRDQVPLHAFLGFAPRPLSARATAGFLGRTAVSTLRFPDGFLARLEAHLARVKNSDEAALQAP